MIFDFPVCIIFILLLQSAFRVSANFNSVRSKAKANRHSLTHHSQKFPLASHQLEVSASRSLWFPGLSLSFAIRQSDNLKICPKTSN